MKDVANEFPHLPIKNSVKPDGTLWKIKEQLFLGLPYPDYMHKVTSSWLNRILFVIISVGLFLIAQRYLYGLAMITHGSNDYPWGLFLGFGLFAMVPLSASGFLLGTTVVIFGRHDFHSIERLALLNGLLGYFFAVVYLEVDLGMPWRLAYPMFVSFGPAAVLFLVAWHVATYLSVQIAELLPALFLWLNRPGWVQYIKRISLGLTIAGIILSTLHQGALGALFTYAPTKIHPLWMSIDFQWIHFFCSAIFGGLSMVIVSSTLIYHFMSWRCSKTFLHDLDRITLGLAKGASYAMFTYLIIKLVAIAHDNEWEQLLSGWGLYYLLEITVGVILPMIMFAKAIRSNRVQLARIAGFITVLGIVWNRLNTSIVCYNYQMYQEIPHWKEIWVTVTIYAIYFITYRFIVYRLPIVFDWEENDS